MSTFMSYLFGNAESGKHEVENKTLGENGMPLMATAEHPGVTAFHKLVRDHKLSHKTGRIANRETPILETRESRDAVSKHVKSMVKTGERDIIENNNYELLSDTFLLAVHKRSTTHGDKAGGGLLGVKKTDTAGGEGERMIYYQMVLELFKYYPKTTIELVKQSPQFGYWLDLYKIWELLCWRLKNEYTKLKGNGYNYMDLIYAIIEYIYNQLVTDFDKLDGYPSHLCKWFAREGAYYDKHCFIPGAPILTTSYTLFAKLIGYYYVEKHERVGSWIDDIITGKAFMSNAFMNKYRGILRRRVAYLNKKLDTFETHACSHAWSAVKPETIPSRCMMKNTKAILNEQLHFPPKQNEEETGNRYPEDEDRIQARKNLIAMLSDPSKIKTSGIEPHEIMKSYKACTSSAQKLVVKSQWNKKVDEVIAQMQEMRAKLIADGRQIPEHIGNLIPMMDVSGSMSGLPMDVSIGMGIFLTYLMEKQGQHPIAISFTDVPEVFNFNGMTLDERYSMVTSNVGYNTNFETALDLVLECIKKTDEHYDLIVFTDGQFDTMNKEESSKGDISPDWTTCHERFLKKVAALNLARAPRIIYWNLRADTQGVQTVASHPGVQLLQGYSTALLRYVLLGEDCGDEEIVVIGETDKEPARKVKVSKTTPYDTYRKALDNDRWDPIRAMLANSNEKHLVGYGWTRC